MRTLTYYMATSVDGFIAGPGGEIDAFTTTGEHMTTIATEYPETLPEHVRGVFGVAPGTPNRHFDTVLMGRATYDPAIAAGIADPYPHLRTIVFSSGPRRATAPTVTADDPVATVRALKQEAGRGIWLAGGGRLAGALLPEIDELIVKCYPVVLGAGVPMFATTYDPAPFELTDVTRHRNGVVFQAYRRAR